MESMVLITQKQLNRYLMIEKSLEEIPGAEEAAEILMVSARQLIQLKNGVEVSGTRILIHKNHGRKPAHTLRAEAIARQATGRQKDNSG